MSSESMVAMKAEVYDLICQMSGLEAQMRIVRQQIEEKSRKIRDLEGQVEEADA